MAHEFILEAVDEVFKERNERVAGILSLLHNTPDSRGRSQFELRADNLEQYRPDWENLDSPVKMDDAVEIPAGCSVGIAPFGGYVTTRIIRGILTRTHSFIGGAGYMERGCKRPDALFHVTASLGKGEGTIDLLVPSWHRLADGKYATVLQKYLGNSPVAQIAV